MHLNTMHICEVPVTDAHSLAKIANDLMIKGSVILGAGIGLYIFLRMIGK